MEDSLHRPHAACSHARNPQKRALHGEANGVWGQAECHSHPTATCDMSQGSLCTAGCSGSTAQGQAFQQHEIHPDIRPLMHLLGRTVKKKPEMGFKHKTPKLGAVLPPHWQRERANDPQKAGPELAGWCWVPGGHSLTLHLKHTDCTSPHCHKDL